MLKPQVYTPKNTLQSMLDAEFAPTPEQLVSDASTRVAGLREKLMVHVRAEVEKVLVYADVPEQQLFSEVDAVGAAALSVAEVAGAAGMAGIGEVARGIRVLTGAVRGKGFWHAEALRLHINTLALLSKTEREDDQGVAEHLHAMRKTLGVGE